MNIFVTVGTTHFDSLIEYLDVNLLKSYDVSFQIADGEYEPKNFPYFRFKNSINNYIDNAEIIITHAGAGSIYSLLENEKRLIVVPNLDRQDKHQTDIAKYVESAGYALCCYDLLKFIQLIDVAESFKFVKYEKEVFFKADEIIDLLGN